MTFEYSRKKANESKRGSNFVLNKIVTNELQFYNSTRKQHLKIVCPKNMNVDIYILFNNECCDAVYIHRVT